MMRGNFRFAIRCRSSMLTARSRFIAANALIGSSDFVVEVAEDIAGRVPGGAILQQPAAPLREQLEQPFAGSGADAALGDEGGDEAGRGYVEGVICGGAVGRGQADGDAPAFIGPAVDMGDLA